MSALNRIKARHRTCEDCGKCREMIDEEFCGICQDRSCERGEDCKDHPVYADLGRLVAALGAVQQVHEPIDAVMYSGSQQRLVKVCTGCGTDDGNWQRFPCPTVKAISEALGEAS